MSLRVQILTLFTMIGCGGVIGIVLDVYRVSCIMLKWKRWFRSILDLCFWIVAAVITIAMLQKVNNGQVHLYIVAAIGVGYYSYSLTCRRFVISRTKGLITFIKKCFLFFFSLIQLIIIKPILFFYKISYALIIGLFLLLYRIVWLIATPFRFIGNWLFTMFIGMWKRVWEKVTRKKD